jgi:hypothetical protein
VAKACVAVARPIGSARKEEGDEEAAFNAAPPEETCEVNLDTP